jgi:hypothetical protein
MLLLSTLEKPYFMLIAFREKNANPKHLSEAISKKAGLDKVVAVDSKNFCQRLRTCQQKAFSVEQVPSWC